MSFGLLQTSGGASIVAPYIPPRDYRLENSQPQNHCNVKQVRMALLGTDLSKLGPCEVVDEYIQKMIIPEVTGQVVKFLRTPYDWCKSVWFFDGNSSESMVLPVRNLAYVNVCFLRVLPSLVWYRFTRFRLVDGSEFVRIGGIEPPPPAPERLPPDIIDVSPPGPPTQPYFTGIEDADMLVDTRRRTIKIPPRVLIAGVNYPIWNYTFQPGVLNVEVHFAFGYPPTSYMDGTPILYNQYKNGCAYTTKPGTDIPIDWSSGMPTALTMSVARICANRLLRQLWRGKSGGFSSISIDGASESYGSSPYGGDLDSEEKAILNERIPSYGIQVVI